MQLVFSPKRFSAAIWLLLGIIAMLAVVSGALALDHHSDESLPLGLPWITIFLCILCVVAGCWRITQLHFSVTSRVILCVLYVWLAATIFCVYAVIFECSIFHRCM